MSTSVFESLKTAIIEPGERLNGACSTASGICLRKHAPFGTNLPRKVREQAMNDASLLATLTCPNPACHHQQQVMMPTTYCQLTYTCEACQTTHSRQAGDCCIFCSYANTVCPSKQEAEQCDPNSSRCLSF